LAKGDRQKWRKSISRANRSSARRPIVISEQTDYRWGREYGGVSTEQAHRLKELEKENVRLKRVVADLSLDNAILKETVKGNF